MKKSSTIFRIKSLTVTIILSLICASPSFSEDTVIKVSSDPWEPWVLGEEGKAPTGGLAVELIKEIFHRNNTKYDITIYPYKRCMAQMKSGERDLLLMVKKTPEREKFMLFSDVAARDPQLFYYNPSALKNFQWVNWSDLKGMRIGGVRGFNYGDFNAKKDQFGLQYEEVAEDMQNIKKLLADRLDLVLLSKSTAEHLIRKDPGLASKLHPAPKAVSEARFHFTMSKKGNATDFVAKINNTLSQMSEDGSLEKILGPYK